MSDRGIEVSVAAPARNEAPNLRPLVEEIAATLDPRGIRYEIIVVDDRSTDDTRSVLADLLSRFPALRTLTRTDRDERGGGQSAAFHAAIRAARGDLVAMLDADLQDDPAELPRLIETSRETGADLVQGDRTGSHRGSAVKRGASWVGWLARRLLLGDMVRDTGCSLRVLERSMALRLPLEFRGMHRFIPYSVKQMGGTVVEVPVRHRPRAAGESKYGIWDRAVPGLLDCLAARWMRSRRCPGTFHESTSSAVGKVASETERVGRSGAG